jgi:CTP:molybdopterin cytidylyltransferase MocA
MRKRAKTNRRNWGRFTSKNLPVVPIILAAGKSPRLGFPQALARFEGRSALDIAVENCTGLSQPIVVLGHSAAKVRAAVPEGARVVVHSKWRTGQLSSLRAALRRIPRHAAFMLYPVDFPLLTPLMIRSLVAGFRQKRPDQTIVLPVFRGRSGHPVIFSPAVRRELASAHSAREVVEKDPQRVKLVPLRTSAIWQDCDTLTSYRQLCRVYRRGLN